jgi:hypothetical protein
VAKENPKITSYPFFLGTLKTLCQIHGRKINSFDEINSFAGTLWLLEST